MNVLLMASISLLFSIFSIIMGFVFKLWLDERNSTRRREALEAMSADGVENTEEIRRKARRQVVNRTADEDLEECEDVGNTGENLNLPSFPSSDEPKIGKKKLAKLQAKAEAKAHREQQQTERQERKKQEEVKQKQEEQERLEQEAEEEKRREKLKAEREERERKELEEYQKLKEDFTLDDQGFEEMDQEQTENLLKAFIEHIKQKKVVHVDELASHFSLSSEDVVNRLESFMSDKLITGVFDDRGKFIYITDQELQSVARFINQRGRRHIRVVRKYRYVYLLGDITKFTVLIKMPTVEFMHSKYMSVTNKWISPAVQHMEANFLLKFNSTRKDCVKVVHCACSECRSVREKRLVLKSQMPPTMKAIEITRKWIDEAPNHSHFCQGRKVSEVKGMTMKITMQAGMASDSKHTVSSAIVRIEKKMPRSGSKEVYQAACTNRYGISQALGRMKQKRFPLLNSFADLVEDQNYLLTLSSKMSRDLHSVQQARMVVEQLRREKNVHRGIVTDHLYQKITKS